MDLPKIACHSCPVIGERIRQARERRGWTQTELATKVGVGYKTVSNWETGNTVPQNRLGMLRDLFPGELDDSPADDRHNALRSYSEMAILNELMRRAVERGMDGGAG